MYICVMCVFMLYGHSLAARALGLKDLIVSSVCVCVYIYIYIFMSILMFIFVCIFVYMLMYVYHTCIHR